RFKAVNGAGEESEVSDPVLIMIDKTVPSADEFILTAVSNGKEIKNGSILTDSVTITLSVRSKGIGDVLKYQYSLNGGEWIDIDSDTVTATEDGFYSYSFRAVSQSGVFSDIKQVVFTIDRDYSAGNNNSNNNATDNANGTGNGSGTTGNIVDNVDIPNTGRVVVISILPLAVAAAAVILAKKARKNDENDE
ncbi:MAG: hypothetical protein J1F23_06635, partial [Oscillospiraceae bacterium]|nr:hypothetical protein [Oscillospiraceae bacterium]